MPKARLGEAGEGRAEPLSFGEHAVLGDAGVLEDELAGDGGAEAHLVLDLVGGEAGGVGGHEEAADDTVVVLGPDEGDVGDAAVADPHLDAVEDVEVAVGAGGGLHGAGIGAAVVLGEAEATDDLAGGHLGEVAPLLLLGAVAVDGVHDQGALDAGEAAEAGVDALKLVHHQAVGDVVEAGGAVLGGQRRSEQADGAELPGEVTGGLAGLPPLADVGRGLVVEEVAGRRLHLLLLGREQVAELVEVEHGVLCRQKDRGPKTAAIRV